MDAASYKSHLLSKESEYEDICLRCGKCCGADNVPCEKLTRLDDGRYHCSDYANRLGQQRSANGRHFHCIPMRLLVRHNTAPIGCAYTKKG